MVFVGFGVGFRLRDGGWCGVGEGGEKAGIRSCVSGSERCGWRGVFGRRIGRRLVRDEEAT